MLKSAILTLFLTRFWASNTEINRFWASNTEINPVLVRKECIPTREVRWEMYLNPWGQMRDVSKPVRSEKSVFYTVRSEKSVFYTVRPQNSVFTPWGLKTVYLHRGTHGTPVGPMVHPWSHGASFWHPNFVLFDTFLVRKPPVLGWKPTSFVIK